MKTKHQTKQRIVSRLVFCFAIMLLLYPAATAQQLEPNPNPVDNTITIESISVENFEYFDNLGTIEIWWGTLDNWETLDNSGTINNWYGYINNWGTIVNSGYIDNDDSILNYGMIDNSGTLQSFGFFYNYGIFKGTGTFVGSLDTGDGTVSPGSSAGTMYVNGSYILDGSGILDIEIGGFDIGEYDLLDITGTAFLPGGNINFSFLDGYDIVTDVGPGDTLELSFLNAGCIDSLFDPMINYNFGSLPDFEFNVFQMGDDLYFQATNTVPVPAAVLLGMLGLSAVGIKMRKFA